MYASVPEGLWGIYSLRPATVHQFSTIAVNDPDPDPDPVLGLDLDRE